MTYGGWRRTVNRWFHAFPGGTRRAEPGRTQRRFLALESLECRTLPGFLSPAVYPVLPDSRGVAVGDFNGDGIADWVSVSYGATNNSDTLSVLLGNGDGTFRPAGTYKTGATSRAVAVGDFNGDGMVDLAVVRFNGGADILLGNGDGTFRIQGDYDIGGNPVNLAVGDFNGDGVPALVTSSTGAAPYNSTLDILLGNGAGSFHSAGTYAIGKKCKSVAVGDFTGNGHLDVVAANEFSNSVSVLLGNGTFQTPVDYSTGPKPVAVVVTDLARDGVLDLVTGNQGSVSVLLGNGNGTFQPATDFAAPGNSIAAADVNGNGFPDIVSTGTDSVTTLINDGHWSTTRAGRPGAVAARPMAVPLARVEPFVLPWGFAAEVVPTGAATSPSPMSALAVPLGPASPDARRDRMPATPGDGILWSGEPSAPHIGLSRSPQPVTDPVVLPLPFTSDDQGDAVFSESGNRDILGR